MIFFIPFFGGKMQRSAKISKEKRSTQYVGGYKYYKGSDLTYPHKNKWQGVKSSSRNSNGCNQWNQQCLTGLLPVENA